jgi:predicted nucleic acid-binding Zn finger protein
MISVSPHWDSWCACSDFYLVVKEGKCPKYQGLETAIPLSAIQSTHKVSTPSSTQRDP